MRSTRRRTHRSDANATALAKTARKLGVLVCIIGRPVDWAVFHCRRGWQMVEVKTESGKYTDDQVEFLTECIQYRAPVLTWRNEQNIIDWVNA